MPRQRCQKNGKPGWRYGPTGTCYTYTKGDKSGEGRAIKLAEAQGKAIRVNQARRGVRRAHGQ